MAQVKTTVNSTILPTDVPTVTEIDFRTPEWQAKFGDDQSHWSAKISDVEDKTRIRLSHAYWKYGEWIVQTFEGDFGILELRPLVQTLTAYLAKMELLNGD